jgi:spore coat polysaccharide biosynthesis predicted glycosyltransferase SpsG/CMP-N-acetylneuraminic acid synthetase
MNILAIIPVLVRNESIPKMFSRFLVKKPLILYAGNIAKSSKFITNIYYYTDDENVAHIAEINALNVITENELNLKEDYDLNTLSRLLLKEIEVKEQQQYEYIVILFPNCPLIKAETIDKSIEDLLSTSIDSAVSVQINKEIHLKLWIEDSTGFGTKFYRKENNRNHKRKLQEINGIIISKRESLLKNQKLITDNVKLIELALPENIIIKNHIDWWMAEKFLKRKRILIRVDGYNKIGLGHIYRTLALATQLIDHELLFVTKKEYDLGIRLIKENNFQLKTIDREGDLERIIAEFNPYIVINDILDTNSEYIGFLKDKDIFIVNFEDLGEGAKKADLVINALYRRKNFLENHYWGKDYYILREEFHLVGKKEITKDVKNILISYGGTDPNNYTEKVLDILENLKIQDLKVNAILGLGYKNVEKLKQKAKNYSFEVNVKQHINHISKYMHEADIALTAAGRTVYELASMGVPTIVLVENERGLLHTFASEENGIINVGLGTKIPDKEIKNALIRLIDDYELRKRNNILMLDNNLRSGISNVLGLIFSEYEKFEEKAKL